MATLQIDFTVPTPVPVNGFIVKYRKIGTTTYNTVFPNPTASPVVITVDAGFGYEGTIQSDCGNSSVSSPYTFSAFASTQIFAQVGASTVELCNSEPVTLYISQTYTNIGPGVRVYTDAGLTTPYTAGGYISSPTGLIYNINSSGFVIAITGNVCGQPYESIAAGFGIGGSDQVSAACATSATGLKYIAAGDTIQLGTVVYQNSSLSVVSGPFSFKIAGNQVLTTNSFGEITAITDC